MENVETPADLTRRSFIQKSGAALAGITIVPRHVLGGSGKVAPSDRLAIAFIGVGSQGLRVMMDFLRIPDVQAVTVCDVNRGSGDYVEWGTGELRGKVRELLQDETWGPSGDGAWAGLEPARDVVQRYYAREHGTPTYRCTAYEDYRELLEKERGIDAVVVGTSDHVHAAVSVNAMHRGKHVFCQKPMARTVYEASIMADVARRTRTATQVATGNSASEATRLLCEWVWDGAIGPVREVHNWSSRPFWPQGIDRPQDHQPAPDHLNWDLWLGPASFRPYHPSYQPFNWRGWHDFGAGAIGDMGCYSFDTIFRVLKLEGPTKVEASSTERFPETYPLASVLHFHFGARPDMPPVVVHWYDGGIKPPAPEEMGNQDLPTEGLLFVGDTGKILCNFNGGQPRLIPESAMASFQPPPQILPRSIGHYEEWISACKGGPAPGASFETARPATETILLGNVALRTGKTIYWDKSRHAITEPSEANGLLHAAYREGWRLG